MKRISALSTRTLFCFSLLFTGSLAGCSHFEPKTPDGFVVLDEEDSSYAYRATSADGVVLAVRDLPHEPKGNLDFWAQAIENQMRTRGGYALISKREVKAQGDLVGRQMRFGHDEGSAPHAYVLTLFVTNARIFVLEAGGPKDLVDKNAAAIDAAVAGFRAN